MNCIGDYMKIIKFRLANIGDLNKINQLFEKVVYDIQNNKKINMWNTEYPFCEFENDIKRKEMYILEMENEIIGSFVLSEHDDPEYNVINWTFNNKKWFSINRLVILPSEQGKGYAKMAMEYICEYATKNKYEVIRLVVHKDNIYAITLYEKYGFRKIENSQWIIYDKIFWGYEKEIR
jgi:Acetyltransferases